MTGFPGKQQKRDHGELKYRLTYESCDPVVEGEAPPPLSVNVFIYRYLNIAKIIHCITK